MKNKNVKKVIHITVKTTMICLKKTVYIYVYTYIIVQELSTTKLFVQK